MVFLCGRRVRFGLLYLVWLLRQTLCQRTSATRDGIYADCIRLLSLSTFRTTQRILIHEVLLFLNFLHLFKNIKLVTNDILFLNIFTEIIEQALQRINVRILLWLDQLYRPFLGFVPLFFLLVTFIRFRLLLVAQRRVVFGHLL